MASILTRIHKVKHTTSYDFSTDSSVNDINNNINNIINVNDLSAVFNAVNNVDANYIIDNDPYISILELIHKSPTLYTLLIFLCVHDDEYIINSMHSNITLYYTYEQLKQFLVNWRNKLISLNNDNHLAVTNQDKELVYYAFR